MRAKTLFLYYTHISEMSMSVLVVGYSLHLFPACGLIRGRVLFCMACYAEILFDIPLKQSFTYLLDEKGEACVGKRAAAPFGRRELIGFISALKDEPPPGLDKERIKKIRRIVDKTPLFGGEEIELAKWLSGYYLCSQGEALAAMLPSGRRAAEFQALNSDDFDAETSIDKPVPLSEEQEAALAAIVGALKPEAGPPTPNSQLPTYYLYGVTGSGKTEVFLRAAEHFLREGRSVIYLVPEISLTHQAAEAIEKRFGAIAAAIHSGLTGSERLAQWMRIKNGEARIVVGPRSAVFSPVRNLGLIIIDEEHDGSFKSGNTPRYNARQVAMYRAKKSGAALVMGSATPSAEAWHLMAEGGLRRLNLTSRISGGDMPEIKIVSLEHCPGCLSNELKEEIKKTSMAGMQTILFLNRRGFAYFYHCPDCGFELKCRHCSVSLTYHKAKGKAVCHYCGYEAFPPSSCPNCGSLEAGFVGFGTELIEEEVKRTFPALRVRRLDADTVGKKGTLQEVLALFKSGAIDILLGTQMVAKGLNFPGVRLAGVVLADTGLHLPDFRAAERTFSLIVQVAGRAGRFSKEGKVIVQTFRPFDPVIERSCALDIEGFFKVELENRREMDFPPFTRLIRISSRCREEERGIAALERLKKLIIPLLPHDAGILGPADCPISKLSGNYRRHLIIRSPNMAALHAAARRALELYETGRDPKVYLETDVDPVSIL